MFNTFHCTVPEEPSDEREWRKWYKDVKKMSFDEDSRPGMTPHIQVKARKEFLDQFAAFVCKEGLDIEAAYVKDSIANEFHEPVAKNMKILLVNALGFVVHNFKKMNFTTMVVDVRYNLESQSFSFIARLPFEGPFSELFKIQKARFILFYNSQEHLFAAIGDESTCMDHVYTQMDKDKIVTYKCESVCGCGAPYPQFYCGGCTATRFCSNDCKAFTTKVTCSMLGCKKKFNCNMCRRRHIRTCERRILVCTDPIYL